ncbi:S-adenosyl-L-methionine-dependent methyltransferase [Aspergillus coremiiformis]|uniref:S-adenosyl-L-methionine-dependent methyltransferase n=1 Tax=Aspergillus coremiiformis TaxID=138285 RepID=A0A5N6Z9G5_9EURO|nr:S-adenosyl-L-methionine-dependent methyltransferase [Aspergillus coremiiformis]
MAEPFQVTIDAEIEPDPNDEKEQDLMDLLHHIYTLILDGEVHIAPIKPPQRVLDLGAGTGIWAVGFADQYPSSEVVGNDLSSIQSKWVPPNRQFEIDGFEPEWCYAPSFDYIYGRELAGSRFIRDFPRLCKQAFSHLRPGGYFEVQSFTTDIFSDEGSTEKAPYTKQVVALLQGASVKFGKPMRDLDKWPTTMRDAGFTGVVCKIVKAPASPRAKDAKQKKIERFLQAHRAQSVPAYTEYQLMLYYLGFWGGTR